MAACTWHPPYKQMILWAIGDLSRERTGRSAAKPIYRKDIKDLIDDSYPPDAFTPTHNTMLSHHLTMLTKKGLLLRFDGYAYALSDSAAPLVPACRPPLRPPAVPVAASSVSSASGSGTTSSSSSARGSKKGAPTAEAELVAPGSLKRVHGKIPPGTPRQRRVQVGRELSVGHRVLLRPRRGEARSAVKVKEEVGKKEEEDDDNDDEVEVLPPPPRDAPVILL